MTNPEILLIKTMNNLEISNILSGEHFFGGVYSSNNIPKHIENKFYVINTQESSLPGNHWVVIYFSSIPEFFDSLGKSPKNYDVFFENHLVFNGPTYKYSTKRVQSANNSLCGLYCIYYCLLRSKGLTFNDIINTLNVICNEDIVKMYVEEYINK